MDFIVAKLDASRAVVWVRHFGGSGDERETWVAIDGAGDLIVVGDTAGGFDMGAGFLDTSGARTRFVAKLQNADGACLWHLLMPSTAGSMGDADDWSTVAIDPWNNVLTSGWMRDTLDVGSVHLSGAGGTDIYVAKLSPMGDVLWAKRWGTSANEAAHGVASDSEGNITLLGSFYGLLSMGGEAFTSRGDVDTVLAKLTPDGDHLWSRQFGGGGADWPGRLAMDPGGNALTLLFLILQESWLARPVRDPRRVWTSRIATSPSTWTATLRS